MGKIDFVVNILSFHNWNRINFILKKPKKERTRAEKFEIRNRIDIYNSFLFCSDEELLYIFNEFEGILTQIKLIEKNE